MRHLTPLQYIDAIARAGSIRKAAETLAITSTALNRRVLALEEELGVPIFERLPRGVRLSTAGELLIQHIRNQVADFEKLKSQIADLAGERRGHVAIACTQALVPYFLPREIASYRRAHPAVTFDIRVDDSDGAWQALADHSVDLALVFEPQRLREVQVLASVPQQIRAVMAPGHPLARHAQVRLSECASFPAGLPALPSGVRRLLENALQRSSATLDIVLQAGSFEFLRRHLAQEDLVTFEIPIGLPDGDAEVIHRPLDRRDIVEGLLHLCQKRGRTMPVAAAKFAQQLERALHNRY